MTKLPLKLLPAEHYNRIYSVFLPPEAAMEEITAPGFWANVAKELRAGDEIKVMAEDMTWRAVLLIRAVGRVEAMVHVLAYDVMGEAATVSAVDCPYAVKWRGPARKWSVIRKDTQDVVKEDFPAQEAAGRWITDHMKAMAS